MRIAFIRRRYTAYGGAERFLERILPHLAGQGGLEATLLAERWSGEALPPWMRWQPIPTLPLGSLARGLSFERNVCRAVAGGGFDLVQSHERVPCADLYRAGDGVHREWLRQRRRVLGPVARARVLINPFHRYLLEAERRLFENPRLRAVITNSEMVKREILADFTLPPERIHTIYSGVDLERFHPGLREQRGSVRRHLGVPADATLFLYLGSGFQRKGLSQVLHTLPPRTWLMVVGKDRDEAAYRRLAHRLRVSDRVRFLGPRKVVEPLYGAADALVLPTLYDPFPNVCFEALAAGLPVITSTKSGAAELIRHGQSGFVCDALDRKALGGYMTALCDAALVRSMGEAARATAEDYPMTGAAQRMTALYLALLGDGCKQGER